MPTLRWNPGGLNHPASHTVPRTRAQGKCGSQRASSPRQSMPVGLAPGSVNRRRSRQFGGEYRVPARRRGRTSDHVGLGDG